MKLRLSLPNIRTSQLRSRRSGARQPSPSASRESLISKLSSMILSQNVSGIGIGHPIKWSTKACRRYSPTSGSGYWVPAGQQSASRIPFIVTPSSRRPMMPLLQSTRVNCAYTSINGSVPTGGQVGGMIPMRIICSLIRSSYYFSTTCKGLTWLKGFERGCLF